MPHAAKEMREAIEEIEHLRGVLVEANNRWRRDFEKDVSDAAERLFKKLSVRNTKPFSRQTHAGYGTQS